MESYVFQQRDKSILNAPLVDFYIHSFLVRIENNVFSLILIFKSRVSEILMEEIKPVVI